MTTPVEDLAGALLIEIFIAVLLYGITTTQVYVYWFSYPDDIKAIRRTVVVVWLLETLHTAFCLHMIYEYMIVDFGHLLGIVNIIWSAGATVIIAVSIQAIVQVFFIRRIWIMSERSFVITAIPAVLLFVRVAFGFATASLTWTIPTWIMFRAETGPFATLITGLTLAALVDLIIALLLIYYLQRSRTGFKVTDHLIKSLMAYVINTGALTMVVSISIVLTFTLIKGSLLFAGLVEIQSKLYANSFLATLNARHHLSGSSRDTGIHTSSNMELSNRRPGLQNDPKRTIEIYQQTSKVNDLGEISRGSITPYAPRTVVGINEQDIDVDGSSMKNKFETLV
ncbi:hypothetical protein B0H21DRAFT_859127 [Amylocystis lapponica]|nr:hypothetical protein B0H21DRAFT_859127 [Amylocystis lapponica]